MTSLFSPLVKWKQAGQCPVRENLLLHPIQSGRGCSAADKIFQPSYLAKGAYLLLTPASLNTAKDYYIGKAAAVGASVGDIVQFVKDSADGYYAEFKSLIASKTTYSDYDTSTFKIGDTISFGSENYKMTGNWTNGTNYFSLSEWKTYLTTVCVANSGGVGLSVQKNGLYALDYSVSGVWPGGITKYRMKIATCASTTFPSTVPPPAGTVDYPGLKNSLDPTVPAGVANEVPNILKAMPASQVAATSSADDNSTPAITQADIAAALKANTAAVAQSVAQAAADIAAANPTDAAAQIAASQAALEAAKAAEAAAEAANQPEPEPEPSYPVPTTWYTKTCDLSNGLGSCIDYQQVINATSAFQSTALYQFPNLILQCLGYVEGDGCEYPPKLSIDLFTRFSTGPLNIDLSPFESVVKVMKFFFSILCLVGTGKATMTLFE